MTEAWQKARATILAGRDGKSPRGGRGGRGRPDRVGRRRLQADPRPRSRLLLRDGHAHHEAAGDGRQHGPRRRSAGDRHREGHAGSSGSRWPARRARCARRRPRWPRACRPRSSRPPTPRSSRRCRAAGAASAATEHVAAGVDPTGSGKVATDNVARGEAAWRRSPRSQQAAAPRLDALLVARMDKFAAARVNGRRDRACWAPSSPSSSSSASSSPRAARSSGHLRAAHLAARPLLARPLRRAGRARRR